MIRFLVVTLLAAVLGASMALGSKPRSRDDEEMRRVAVEEACRTIVEAGLVRSCTIRNSLQRKQ